MTLEKPNYLPRLVDQAMAKYLNIFGAVSIEGPKWCGKTWTGLKFSESVAYLSEKSVRDLAKVDPKYIFTEERPQLIDEWQLAPGTWDAVRHACDESGTPGNFILTGSTTLEKSLAEEEIHHSGTGRIVTLKMRPMSLQESGDSNNKVSISALRDGDFSGGNFGMVELSDLAQLIVRGGWPSNLKTPAADAGEIPKSYIESVITKDIHERKDRKRNSEKMRMLLKSLARNESSTAGNDTLVKDIEEYETEGELLESRHTVADYLGALDALYLTSNQGAFSVNYRSSKRVGKMPKRHLVDPSLSCALLGLSVDKLLKDHHSFGLLFEALVERDLQIYIDSLGGKLFHFRDNASGDEVDAILEFSDGEYAAVEIKLSDASVPEAISSLTKFSENAEKKPVFMCVVAGHLSAAYQDAQTGVYVVPATSLCA